MTSLKLNKKNSILLSSDKSVLTEARNFVTETLCDAKFSDRDKQLMLLAVDEAVSQIVNLDDPDHTIQLGLEVDDVKMMARIIDSKNDFGMDAPSGQSVDEKWRKEQSRRQLSVFMIREIMDEVNYVYRRGFENELNLLKFMPANN